jgi:hypothetical protein
MEFITGEIELQTENLGAQFQKKCIKFSYLFLHLIFVLNSESVPHRHKIYLYFCLKGPKKFITGEIGLQTIL